MHFIVAAASVVSSAAVSTTASTSPPLPPVALAVQFQADYRLHSAAAVVQTYFYKGRYSLDVNKKRQTGTNCMGGGPTCFTDDSLALCDGRPGSGNATAVQFYLSNASAGCERVAKPLCPLVPEFVIPQTGTTWNGEETVNGVLCNKWSYYSPSEQSAVNAWTMVMNDDAAVPGTETNPPLIRFVGLRVQHDFFNVTLGEVPAEAFAIPAKCDSPPHEKPSTRVLFVGNSFTFVNDLPHQLINIAASLGKTVEVANSTIGGCTAYAQRPESDARTAMLLQEEWDFIVLQSYSILPTIQKARSTYYAPAVASFEAKKKDAKVCKHGYEKRARERERKRACESERECVCLREERERGRERGTYVSNANEERERERERLKPL